MIFLMLILIVLRFLHIVHIYQLEHYNFKGYYLNIHKKLFDFKIYKFKYKIKLKFTTRIYRTLLVNILILLLVSSSLYKLILVYFFLPIIFLVSQAIVYPIEYGIRKYYFNKASKKLNNSKVLNIAITGSYGKTSVKNYLSKILNTRYRTIATPRSYNTPMGISKVINNTNINQYKYFISELGATKRNDINELCKLVKPRIAIITEIGNQHLDSFKSIENIVNTKFELYEYKTIEKIFLNYDNKYIKNYKLSKNIETITYGSTNDCDYYIESLVIHFGYMSFNVYYKKLFLMKVRTKLIGKHNALNLLVSIAVAHNLKYDNKDILKGINYVTNPKNRLEIKKVNNKTIIDDSFNSNEIGFINALEVLNSYKCKKVIITPGLVEVSNKVDEIYKGIGNKISDVCDICLLVGKNSLKLKDNIKDVTVYEFKEFKSAYNFAMSIEEEAAILIENDLPDNY